MARYDAESLCGKRIKIKGDKGTAAVEVVSRCEGGTKDDLDVSLQPLSSSLAAPTVVASRLLGSGLKGLAISLRPPHGKAMALGGEGMDGLMLKGTGLGTLARTCWDP